MQSCSLHLTKILVSSCEGNLDLHFFFGIKVMIPRRCEIESSPCSYPALRLFTKSLPMISKKVQ